MPVRIALVAVFLTGVLVSPSQAAQAGDTAPEHRALQGIVSGTFKTEASKNPNVVPLDSQVAPVRLAAWPVYFK